jgi:hypothetical protein
MRMLGYERQYRAESLKRRRGQLEPGLESTEHRGNTRRVGSGNSGPGEKSGDSHG